MHIDGNTELIAHIGFPTASFKAPMIYNPWFEKAWVNAEVLPGVDIADACYAARCLAWQRTFR